MSPKGQRLAPASGIGYDGPMLNAPHHPSAGHGGFAGHRNRRLCILASLSIIWLVLLSLTVAESAGTPALVIGHRGAAGLAPENTLAGFERALACGVDAIELDVHLTAEGLLAVHHGYRLKPEITRLRDGTWIDPGSRPLIKDLTRAELLSFDVGRIRPGSAYARRYPQQQAMDGQRIPTLRQVLRRLRQLAAERLEIWVEIKTSPKHPRWSAPPQEAALAVARVVREEGFDRRVRVLSFDWRSLAHIRRAAPGLPTVYLTSPSRHVDRIIEGRLEPSLWTAGLLLDHFAGSLPRAILAGGGCCWAAKKTQLTQARLEEAHGLGLRVYVWTVDEPWEMERFLDMGVDGIITNRPDKLRQLIRTRDEG